MRITPRFPLFYQKYNLKKLLLLRTSLWLVFFFLSNTDTRSCSWNNLGKKIWYLIISIFYFESPTNTYLPPFSHLKSICLESIHYDMLFIFWFNHKWTIHTSLTVPSRKFLKRSLIEQIQCCIGALFGLVLNVPDPELHRIRTSNYFLLIGEVLFFLKHNFMKVSRTIPGQTFQVKFFSKRKSYF